VGLYPRPGRYVTLFQSPSAANKAASYNSVNELTNLAGQPFTYDANGNLASDGQRNYFWDAENRLAAITYAAQPGKQTSFSYDGLGRRTAITTAVSGSAATTFHLWCGARLCQASNANGAPARSYYDEGEVDYASGTQLYYGPDRLGSVRAAANGQSSALQFYDYDPYGNPLQTPAGGPLTDFRYAGMFYHADSGLYLTQYRAYDPRTARWLSRDPVVERTALTNARSGVPRPPLMSAANLYAYVGNNPVNNIDPLGLFPNIGLPPAPPPSTDCPDDAGDIANGGNTGMGNGASEGPLLGTPPGDDALPLTSCRGHPWRWQTLFGGMAVGTCWIRKRHSGKSYKIFRIQLISVGHSLVLPQITSTELFHYRAAAHVSAPITTDDGDGDVKSRLPTAHRRRKIDGNQNAFNRRPRDRDPSRAGKSCNG
jgi:RHS repeat-associated protein